MTRKIRPVLLSVGLVMAVLPLVASNDYLISLLADVLVFAIFAMSYDLLAGVTGILSFGHALFFGTGAYALALLLQHGFDFAIAVVAAPLAAALLAALMGLLSLRVAGVYYAMVTLAFAEVFYLLAEKLTRLTGGADGLSRIPLPAWASDIHAVYWLALGVAVLTYLGLVTLVRRPLGLALVAVRESETRAAALGYDVLLLRLTASVLAGMIAAVAGALHTLVYAYVSPTVLSVNTTIDGLLMVIIGGSGTIWGPALGALVVRLLSNVLSSLFAQWLLMFGLIYVLIVLFLPKGLAGLAQSGLGRPGTRMHTRTPMEGRGL